MYQHLLQIISLINNNKIDLYKKMYLDLMKWMLSKYFEMEQENIMFSPLTLIDLLNRYYLVTNYDEQKRIKEFLVKDNDYKKLLNLHYDMKQILKTDSFLTNTSTWFIKNDFIDKICMSDYVVSNNKEAIERMNQWISQNTFHKAKDFIKELDKNQIYSILTTLSFKGEWNEMFEYVKEGEFYSTKGVSSVVMMNTKNCEYIKQGSLQGFKKIFAADEYGFVAIQSNSKNEKQLINEFIDCDINKLLSQKRNETVSVNFPAFKYQDKINVNDMLKQAGMKLCFESNIPIKVNVKQNSMIDVNDKGCLASMIMEASAIAASGNDIYLTFDSPFLYMIYHKHLMLPVLIGYVSNPIGYTIEDFNKDY